MTISDKKRTLWRQRPSQGGYLTHRMGKDRTQSRIVTVNMKYEKPLNKYGPFFRGLQLSQWNMNRFC